MAGMIEFAPDKDWLAASWLFDWVLTQVSSLVEDDSVAGRLHEIVEYNLGSLVLDDFTTEERNLLVTAFAERLLPHAREHLRLEEGFDLDEALEHIKALAATAKEAA